MRDAGILSLYVFVYSYYKRVRAQSEFNLDFGHFGLVRAQRNKLLEFSMQQSLRKEVGDVAVSPDKLDSQLTVLNVATVFEESHLHVFVITWRLRIVRSKD